MAKKREDYDTDQPETTSASTPGQDGDELRRAGGRTIARWKQAVFKEMPAGSDEQIAERLTQLARQEGFDYTCTPEAVARWRQADAAPHSPSPARQESQEEGHAIVVLRQLVFLLGKDAVKKLIDSL